MAGNLEWALRPGGRYLPEDSAEPAPVPSFRGPTGLGTTAARIGLAPAPLGLRARSYHNAPRQLRKQIELPEFYLPFRVRTNGELETAREHGKAYIRRTGVLDAPGRGIWDEASVDAADFAPRRARHLGCLAQGACVARTPRRRCAVLFAGDEAADLPIQHRVRARLRQGDHPDLRTQGSPRTCRAMRTCGPGRAEGQEPAQDSPVSWPVLPTAAARRRAGGDRDGRR